MRVGLFVAAICAAIFTAYFVFEPSLPFYLPFSRRYVIAIILVALIALAIFARSLLASLTAGLFTLIAIEFAFLAAPGIFPDNVRLFVESGAPVIRPENMVERLPHSPFAKPKPNVLIHIPGYYGSKDHFEYEWRADRRGFKNLPEIAALDRVEAVAVGDSFTEGMGVAIADTWASRLSKKGHPTYSLGIQGYSPTQFLGAYEHYGRQLNHKWVIIGLLGNAYEREKNYLGSSIAPGPQAIDRLIQWDEVSKKNTLFLETRDGYRVPLVINQRHRFLTSAVIALAAQQMNFALFFDAKSGVPNPDEDARFSQGLTGLDRYRGEIDHARTVEIDPTTLAASPAWVSTLSRFKTIIDLARESDAGVLLLFFPSRGTAYSPTLFPNAFDLVQARALTEFAEKHGVPIIDFTPIFRARAEDRPYLLIDGHPSAVGHEIIASEIAAKLKAGSITKGDTHQ